MNAVIICTGRNHPRHGDRTLTQVPTQTQTQRNRKRNATQSETQRKRNANANANARNRNCRRTPMYVHTRRRRRRTADAARRRLHASPTHKRKLMLPSTPACVAQMTHAYAASSSTGAKATISQCVRASSESCRATNAVRSCRDEHECASNDAGKMINDIYYALPPSFAVCSL
jgi:hypothetical protein